MEKFPWKLLGWTDGDDGTVSVDGEVKSLRIGPLNMKVLLLLLVFFIWFSWVIIEWEFFKNIFGDCMMSC